MINSTRSRESAFRSSTNAASGLTSSSSTPSCSTTSFFSRSYVVDTGNSLLGAGAVLPADRAGDAPENAIHQAAHRVSTVGAGEFDPFGDRHPGRRRRV